MNKCVECGLTESEAKEQNDNLIECDGMILCPVCHDEYDSIRNDDSYSNSLNEDY